MPGQPARAADPRLLALSVIERVIVRGESLATALPDSATSNEGARAQALCYGVLRWYGRFDALLKLLLAHPLKAKDGDLRFLLMLGLYELQDERNPDYAIVSSTVEAASTLGKPWAKGLLNAVLRRFIRERTELEKRLQPDPGAHYSFPAWMIRRLQTDWSECWMELLEASNRQAPMFLRVDLNATSREDYIRLLEQKGIAAEGVANVAGAVRLCRPCAVEALPGFDSALISVQDAAAQQAAPLLDPRPGERLLDACAAPGGKTLHLLQLQPRLAALIAVEAQPARLERVRENLRRASLESKAELFAADVAETTAWWDGRLFDRILLDVPCTASGVIRRHPDIKWLRREQDVAALVGQQRRILEAVWPALAPGGLLLYCTCSLLRCENEQQIAWFLRRQPDAVHMKIELPDAVACEYGIQILVGSNQMDGFFYAALRKRG